MENMEDFREFVANFQNRLSQPPQLDLMDDYNGLITNILKSRGDAGTPDSLTDHELLAIFALKIFTLLPAFNSKDTTHIVHTLEGIENRIEENTTALKDIHAALEALVRKP